MTDETPGRAWLLGVRLGDVEPCDDPSGWPEFSVTLRFYVSSDDPEAVERERKRLFNETDWTALDLDSIPIVAKEG